MNNPTSKVGTTTAESSSLTQSASLKSGGAQKVELTEIILINGSNESLKEDPRLVSQFDQNHAGDL